MYPQVTRLTISMLLQYLRTAEVSVESAIAWNLVHLALVAPQSAFVDILRAFCTINRADKVGDDYSLNSMVRCSSFVVDIPFIYLFQVMAAQTRLAQSVKLRSEFYDVYLLEMLSLFADKGTALQTAKTTSNNANEVTQCSFLVAPANSCLQVASIMEELCSLLLPLDALLSHEDFQPHLNPTPLLTTRYRNLWLLCVLFEFTNVSKRPDCMTEWHVQALMRIAEKTPPIVLEDTYGFVSAELEYNPILRQDYLQEV